MSPAIQFLGRLHPMLLHAPIGLMIGLVALEAVSLARRQPIPRPFRSTLAWLVALCAVASATTGFILSYEGGFAPDTVRLHMWLGISVAAGATLAAVAQHAGSTAIFRSLLAITAIVLVPAGHLGASLTHGADFLTEPFADHPVTPAPAPPGVVPTSPRPQPGQPADGQLQNQPSFATVSAIFNSRCINCHGPSRQKSGLALNTAKGLKAGSRNGPVIVPGDPASSRVVMRLRLPPDDDDHMPPTDKPQPTPEEIKTIEDWIAAGATFDVSAVPPTSGSAEVGAPAPATASPAPAPPPPPPMPDPAALQSLRDSLANADPVERGSNLLTVDFSAVASRITETDIRRLLTPLADHIADLTIARAKIGDDLMDLIAQMPKLRRLNATSTAITDAGLAKLVGNAHLEELVLARTKVSDAAADTLAALPSLKHVYLWQSAVTPAGLAALRARHIPVDAGDTPDAAALEKETEIALTTDAAPTPSAADALKPINTVCPVTGKPLDPDYAVIYKGRVIGFCCQHCAAQFLENPEKFADKLPQ